MTALALVLAPRAEDALIPGLVERGHRVAARLEDSRGARAWLGEGGRGLVLASADPRRLDAALLEECDARGTRLIAVASGDVERRYAASLGLYEVVDAHDPWPRAEALLASPVTAEAPPPRSGRGRVTVVWGPAGAPGRTTVALNLAAELAGVANVALVDADSYGGCVAPALRLLDEAPGFAAACRLAGADALTTAELERVADRCGEARHPLRVLTGIGRPSRWPELGAQRVGATLAACRDWVEEVVVDVGFSLEADEEIASDLLAPRRNAATLAALEAADRVIAVGLADPLGLPRLVRGHAALTEIVPRERVEVVVNRVRRSASGLRDSRLESVLARFAGLRDPVLVPEDGEAMDAALLSGRPLAEAAPHSAARAALRALAGLPDRAPGRRRRARGNRGASA